MQFHTARCKAGLLGGPPADRCALGAQLQVYRLEEGKDKRSDLIHG
jgi:hypothetical protein